MKNSLKEDLARMLGKERCLFEAGDLRAHASDMWPQSLFWKRRGETPYLPDAVVMPECVEEIQTLLRYSQKEKIPVIPFGGGSGVCGGTLPLQGGIVLDLKRMSKLHYVDGVSLTARAESGIMGHVLDAALAKRGFTMGHYPASLDSSTLGGWVATRSAGQLSTKYGSIENMVVALKIVLPTGELLETPLTPRAASGPDWNFLFLGCEGTLGVVTEVTFKIWPLPQARHFLSFSFEGMERGFEAVQACLQAGIFPAAVRLYDELDTTLTMSALGMSLSGVLLILSFEGDESLVVAEGKRASSLFEEMGGKPLGEAPGEHWWKHRFDLNHQLDLILKEPRTLIDTIDVAALWPDLPKLYKEMQEGLSSLFSSIHILCHLSHAYPQGASLYFTFVGVPPEEESEDSAYQKLWELAMELCLKNKGTVSHHHGIGYLKAKWMEKFSPTGLELFRRIKKILDPAGILNPGKMGL